MRVTLNLSSRPYVELRPVFARLRILAGVLVVVALVLWGGLRSLERSAAIADASVSHWVQQTQNLQSEWQQDQTMMLQPENAATLDKSHFLNDLFARKAFSWTAALMDLENVLPAGVQVVSIDPTMTKDGHVMVRLHVSGERDKAVELVKNLETSRHFLNPHLASESAQQEATGRPGFVPQPTTAADVSFDILAEYNPQRMEEVSTSASTARENKAHDRNHPVSNKAHGERGNRRGAR